MKLFISFLIVVIVSGHCLPVFAAKNDPIEGAELGGDAIFDDKALINGYTDKYAAENKDVLLAMIGDDSLGAYKMAAAIRVFKQKYAAEILKNEKSAVIRMLLRRLNRSDSALCRLRSCIPWWCSTTTSISNPWSRP